ncbi:MAG: hypothetical protein ACJATI_005382 [Halioglobus sp.]|jgi:hypothetical protein
MKTLHFFSAEIPDYRRRQGQRFTLAQFLEMVVIAGMSGYFGLNSIGRFIKNNATFFIERYNLQHGAPSSTSVQNILTALPYESLNVALHKWMKQYLDTDEDMWINIDGKSIRSTVVDKYGEKQNYKSILSAFSEQLELTIGTKPMENKKKSEILIARELIEKL